MSDSKDVYDQRSRDDSDDEWHDKVVQVINDTYRQLDLVRELTIEKIKEKAKERQQEETRAAAGADENIPEGVSLTPQQREFFSTGYVTSKKGKAPMKMKKGVYPFKTSAKIVYAGSVQDEDEEDAKGGSLSSPTDEVSPGKISSLDLEEASTEIQSEENLQPQKDNKSPYPTRSWSPWDADPLGDAKRSIENAPTHYALFDMTKQDKKKLYEILSETFAVQQNVQGLFTEPLSENEREYETELGNVKTSKVKKLKKFFSAGKLCGSGKSGSYHCESPSYVKVPQPEPVQSKRYSVEPSVFSPGFQNLMTIEQQFSSNLDDLKEEFWQLVNEPIDDTYKACLLPINQFKIRSLDIVCLDSTRVKLDGNRDFIHANYVSGYNQTRGYICCQSPTSNTVEDFWTMVWQENCRVLVMTMKLLSGEVESMVYWPESVHRSKRYGVFEIQTVSELFELHHRTLVLNVINTATGETRQIYHMLFFGWPIEGLPSMANGFLAFILRTRYYQLEAVRNDGDMYSGHKHGYPLLVHCRTGTGLSAMFICLDLCMYFVDALQRININEVVRNMRLQRALALNHFDLYVFVFLALLAYAKFKKYFKPRNANEGKSDGSPGRPSPGSGSSASH